MNEKDKNNFRGLLNKCFRETNVYIYTDHKVILPIFQSSLTDEIINLINQKLKNIMAIYEELDIRYMILHKIANFLNYDVLQEKISNNTGNTGFDLIGKLPDLLDQSKFVDIADNIIKELVNPTKSYALVQLPNVELPENIRINNDLFLIADIGDYFTIADADREYFNFPLENNKTYLLIEQVGWGWKILDHEQSLAYKNLLQKLKIFIGLSFIINILDTSSTPINKSKEKRNIALPVGIFSSTTEWSEGLWYEGVSEEEEGWYDPIPEDHPDFDDLKETYSGSDELKEFCFQKRFFIEDEINLPQIYVDRLNSLTITEYATKPSFNLIKGEIIEPLPHFEKLESPGQFLRKKFENVRIILNSTDHYAERIKAASLWYLEGNCAESDTFKFIDYTIAVESLLGGKDKINIPLAERLSDRCGFSLGKNLKGKEKIKKDFKEIYDIRSRIVHIGKVILNKNDKEYLKELEKMTKKLISNAIKTY
mgnify:CR=1 FL=1